MAEKFYITTAISYPNGAPHIGHAYEDVAADAIARFNCSYDRFIRTTDPDHLPSTHELWRRMEERGDIYLSKYSGWYSVRDEAYYDESETTLRPDGTRVASTASASPVEWI